MLYYRPAVQVQWSWSKSEDGDSDISRRGRGPPTMRHCRWRGLHGPLVQGQPWTTFLHVSYCELWQWSHAGLYQFYTDPAGAFNVFVGFEYFPIP